MKKRSRKFISLAENNDKLLKKYLAETLTSTDHTLNEDSLDGWC